MRVDVAVVKSGVSRAFRPDDGHKQAFHRREGRQRNDGCDHTQICDELPARNSLGQIEPCCGGGPKSSVLESFSMSVSN